MRDTEKSFILSDGNGGKRHIDLALLERYGYKRPNKETRDKAINILADPNGNSALLQALQAAKKSEAETGKRAEEITQKIIISKKAADAAL